MYYYFYNYKVETATVKIWLEDWQELTQEEIIIYQNNDYDNIEFINNKYCFTKNIININLDEYKASKIEKLSRLSFILGEEIIPNYKYSNCLISKNLVERGEDPIYPNYLNLMIEYENSRVSLRKEFYRCKGLIESATTKEEIDNITIEYEKRA